METKNPQSYKLCGFDELLWMAMDKKLVEAGGIEPPSASTLQAVLHT